MTTKLKPEDVFTSMFATCRLTREEIADMINDALEEFEIYDANDVVHFAKDDPRLTDEVCYQFTNHMADTEEYLEAAENVLEEYPEIRTPEAYADHLAAEAKKVKKAAAKKVRVSKSKG